MFQICLFKVNKWVFSKISLVNTFSHIIHRGRDSCKLINKYNWEEVRQVRLNYGLLKSLFMMQLVMLSIAVAVCLVTLVGLFIVGTIINSNIKFTKLWTFLFVSKSRRLTLKSPTRKKVLLTVVLSERIFLKKVSHTFESPLRGLYITLKTIFLVWLFSISVFFA